MGNLNGRKAIFVLPSVNFRDPEFLTPKKILEDAGAAVLTSSTAPISKGAEGASVKVDVPLPKLDPSDYDATIFVGGPGSSEYFDNPTAHEIGRASCRERV
jgi:protease I